MAKTCAAHRAALEEIQKDSKKRVNLPDGSSAPVHSFERMFPSNCHFTDMVADGLPQTLTYRTSFKEYVSDLDIRATTPSHHTIHKIADVKLNLVQKERRKRIALKRKFWRGRRWYGLQIDLWVDDETSVCFAALSWSYSEASQARTDVVKEPLEMEQFPYTRHAFENIKKWIEKVLDKWGLPPEECSGITPDGEKAGVSALW